MPTIGPFACQCGAPVRATDLLRRGLVTARQDMVFSYAQYRCPVCGRVGEKLLARQEAPPEPPAAQPAWLAVWAEETPDGAPELGPIEALEIEQFAAALRRVGSADLARLSRDSIL